MPPGHLLNSYWGGQGHFRPAVDVLLRGREEVVLSRRAVLDSGSPYIAFDEQVAKDLGLRPPFARKVVGHGVGGQETLLSFPEDGEVQILLTDYVNGYCLWAPLVGFLLRESTTPEPEGTVNQRAILGMTGFFQHLDVSFRHGSNPGIEVEVGSDFPGLSGKGKPPRGVWTLLQRPA